MDGFTTRAIGPGQLRNSVRLERADDLPADVAQALEAPARAG